MDSLLPVASPREPFDFTESDVSSLGATWGALRQHTLRWHPDTDLAALLDQWEERLTGRGDPDTAAMVTWPSRDTAVVPALVRRGFAPPARDGGEAGRAFGARGPGARRSAAPARQTDVAVAVELHMLQVSYDAQFGVVTERANSAELLRADITGRLDRPEPSTWLAEVDWVAVGLLYLDLPQHADWTAGCTCASPVTYLGCLAVRPDFRGAGVGSALAAHAHRVVDESGVAVTLLHHALPNPVSAPFWYSRGYRPLWTTWQRRPAVPG